MKKLLLVVLALVAWPIESKESKKKCYSVKVRKVTAACFGEDTGKIKFCVEGNTAPYKAVLKSATPDSSFKPRKITDIPNEASLEFECLPPGTYNLFLTSTCSSQSLSDIVVPESSQIGVSIDTITPACFGEENGTMSFTVTGGTPPYRAKLFNSNSEVVQRIPTIQPGVTTTAQDLPAGMYSLVVTDEHGCRVTTPGIIVPQATQIVSKLGIIMPAYLDFSTGQIPFTITGGTPPYTATLLNSKSEVVQTITDIQEGEQTIFINLPADTYSIVITDINGCTETVAPVVVPSSPVIVKVVEPVTPTCFGESNGTIPFAVTGGFGPYTATLLNSNQQIVQTLLNVQEGVSTTFRNLPADTYSIAVEDTLGNPGSISNIVVKTLPQIIASLGPVTPTLPGESTGTISFSVTGGAAPYTAQLENSNGQVVQTLSSIQPGVTTTFVNIPAGTYSIDVTDASGCSQTLTSIVLNNSLAQFLLNKYC